MAAFGKKLTVTILLEDETDEDGHLVGLLREITKKVKKGQTFGEEQYCAGAYRFKVEVHDDKVKE